jgi:hypothetical protein
LALNVQKGVITSPAATGNVTYSLPANFDPRAIILWVTYQTADGVVKANGQFCMGIGTYDGGVAQQWYSACWSQDNQAASQMVRGFNTTAILKGYNTVSAGIDYVVSFVSFQTGATSNFVLNWSDLPTTASILVHYLVLGGSDITAAKTGTIATGTLATTDVPMTAGWGQPNLLLLAHGSSTTLGDSGASVDQGFGAASSPTSVWYVGQFMGDGAANVNVGSWQGAAAVTAFSGTPGQGGQSQLSDQTAWPADGFQLNNVDTYAVSRTVLYLALKGTFSFSITSDTAPVTAAPQTQTYSLASGSACRAAIFWGNSVPANPAVDATNADLFGHFLGATDGTTQGVCGHLEDDANATSACSNFFSRSKTIQHYVEAGLTVGTLQSEAGASISGSDATLTWNDTDTVARQFGILLLGDAAAAGPPPTVTAWPAAILGHM